MKARALVPLVLVVLLVLRPAPVAAQEVALPLPNAPVRVVIPDASALDAALGGDFRTAFLGEPRPDDPVPAAWRQSALGYKLEDQWGKFAGDLPWTWREIRMLQPRAAGLALLDVGNLEMVLVIETPLAALPITPPAGTPMSHRGVSYAIVARGAADDDAEPGRRPGLAWTHMGQLLVLATSERALRLTIDEAQDGRGMAPPLPGLVSMELDLAVLRGDRYFRREFVFPEGPETGRLRAALRLEDGQLVEVREGEGEPRGSVYVFEAPGAIAAGWEPEGRPLWPALRAGLLEPVPEPSPKPVPGLAPLPPSAPAVEEDRYAVNFTRPMVAPGVPPWEEGDVAQWWALFEREHVASWGYWLGGDGMRLMVFKFPAARHQDLLDLCRTTVARRAGRATLAAVGDAQEIRVGPALVALGVRRTGDFVWVGPSARDLARVPTPQAATDVVRWARVDLDGVRGEGARWARVEGPSRPEVVRPLSDRVLGVLGWMPSTTSLSVERRRTASGWSERVVFEGRAR